MTMSHPEFLKQLFSRFRPLAERPEPAEQLFCLCRRRRHKLYFDASSRNVNCKGMS